MVLQCNYIGLVMSVQKAKVVAKSLNELVESSKDLGATIAETTKNAASIRKLYREGNKSKLIQLGVSVFLIPEPTPICDVVGAGLVAAGLIQQHIKNKALYIDDIPSELKRTLRELQSKRNYL